MAKLVECVPNFSEGNNKEVIDALGQAISQTPGCVLLDVDAGASTNRTVYTFVGSPEAIIEGALNAARMAGQLIDMSRHTGEHPRMGALDVCPFVPVMNVSMEECVTCAHIFGQRLAAELGVPVYLYGEAAREESRKALPAIRAGEYEALPEKALNLPVVGSQLVGLVPKKAMLDTAEFYIKKEKLFILEEEQKIRLVISRLGLDSLSPFHPRERIIEYLVQAGEVDRGLVAKPLGAFVRAVGGRSAAPGGGSVSAAAAALGAALGCMVGLMSYGKRQFEELDPIMRKLIPPFHQAMDELVAMVDTDSCAFSSYMEAMKLPKSTPEERERRTAAMQQGLKTAVKVPCALAEKVSGLWPALKELARHCNLACKSDIQVGAKMLEAAVFGAYFNVMINLKDITDEKFKLVMSQKVSGLLEEAKRGSALVLELLEKRAA
ncbi:formimidoyltransferase-cyclodeaminase isoform X3 [Strix uralensis]|uniref:formimidoyltransferase-cyclodeaminase isoform X3 n=1 Tax=Strix uralensis TaxID=36305 RepID=UPI003DA79545